MAIHLSTLSSLFVAHSREQQQRAETLLKDFDCDGLLISSGRKSRYFLDDQDVPFRENPHFKHWTPLKGSNHLLYIRRGEKPLLIRVTSKDFWYAEEPLGKPFWLDAFEMIEVNSRESAWKSIASRHVLYIGDDVDDARAQGIANESINSPELLEKLDWYRSFKTPYEVACLSEANRIAGLGHRAARDAFLEGKSEREIHYAYLKGAGVVERELPYETIVALNHHSATLHYQHKEAVRPDSSDVSLLVDAGAEYCDYASDITRTYVSPQTDGLFVELLKGVEKLQKELCTEIEVGTSFSDLHRRAHEKIAELLISLQILKTDASSAYEQGFSKVFFPHGVGHFLGLQVHDVGNMQNKRGTGAEKTPKNSEYLRNSRVIEVGQVFTVEPGIYFIDMLLQPHRSGETAQFFNWDIIDHLKKYGGVRIEDNLFVSEKGVRNLTREVL